MGPAPEVRCSWIAHHTKKRNVGFQHPGANLAERCRDWLKATPFRSRHSCYLNEGANQLGLPPNGRRCCPRPASSCDTRPKWWALEQSQMW